MDPLRFQTSYPSSICELGCPHYEADSLSTFQIWAVSCKEFQTKNEQGGIAREKELSTDCCILLLLQEVFRHNGIEEHELG
jgi:hypothetical protein